MKKLIFIILFTFYGSYFLNAQGMFSHGQGPLKKIEELERVKLIETLNMNEQTTLKFFSRRDKFRHEQEELFKKATDILQNLDTGVNSAKPKEDEIRNLIAEYTNIEGKISSNKENFVNSLQDILTPEQIGKYLVFERKFRDEIREVIFRERKRGKK